MICRNIYIEQYDNASRQVPGTDAAIDRKKSFRDAKLTFTEEQVKAETARCLSCGATKVDPYLCVGCGLCTTKCKFDAVKLVKKYDAWGMPFEKLPIAVAGHVVKRTVNIAAKGITGKK